MSSARGRTPPRPRRPLSRVAVAGLGLAVPAALAALLPGPAYRLDGWSLGTAFAALRWAVYAGIAAAAVPLVGAVPARPRGPRRGFACAVAGLVVGLAVVGVPLSYVRTARSVPPIHDITTDTGDPPRFEAILPLRAEAPNPAAYAGAEVAARQRAAYPDVAPATVPAPPDEAFERALAAARAMGWEVAAAGADAGRIEATDATFWFGFEDDVVVRVRPAGAGSRVDVRSKPRVGVGDLGVNAARVRRLLQELRERS